MNSKDDGKRNSSPSGSSFKIGVNQAIGGLLATIAFMVLFLTFSSTTFPLATHWPGAVAGLAVLGLARYYLRTDRRMP